MVMYEINFISPILFKKIKKMISIKYFLIKKKIKIYTAFIKHVLPRFYRPINPYTSLISVFSFSFYLLNLFGIL